MGDYVAFMQMKCNCCSPYKWSTQGAYYSIIEALHYNLSSLNRKSVFDMRIVGVDVDNVIMVLKRDGVVLWQNL